MRFEIGDGRIVNVDVSPQELIGALQTTLIGEGALMIDGVVADPSSRVGAVWDGSSIRSGSGPAEDGAVVDLVGVRGLDSGGRWRLAPGQYDLTKRGGPRLVVDGDRRVAVGASGAGQGFPEGGLFEAAGTTWRIEAPAGDLRRPDPVHGRRTFNRPPRQLLRPRSESIDVPAVPEDPTPRARMNWAMLAGPVVVGLIMAVVFRPIMAVIALVGPLLMVSSWIEDRIRLRTIRRDQAIAWRRRLESFEGALGDAAQIEVARRESVHPQIPDVVRCATEMGTALWERRPHHPDFLRVAIGRGRSPWELPVRAGVGVDPAPEVAKALEGWATLPEGPVDLDLSVGTMVGIVGDRETALATARAILVRLTVHHGPADFRLAIITDVPADWMWCSWLPHARLDALSGRYRLASREEDVETVIASLTQDSGDAALLVVVDAPGFDPRLRARLAALVDGGSIAAVVVESSMDRLPGTCGTIVTVAGPLGCVRCPSVGDVTEVKVDGVAYDVANGTARHLYGVDDPEEHHEGARLPSRVGLGELHDGRLEVDDLIHRWRNSPPGLVATIGVTENGPLTIDLVADGPHGLVAGTTGSGKSEFLRSMIGALALRYGPDRVTFALVDYKGGSAFDACAGLPHVVGLITDLDRRLGSRALQSLEAELRHRERVLREVGVDHIDAYPRLDGLSPLPRLLVMIDEFAALAADVPEFVPSLVDIAQRGRSLGVHLILATQRPAGVVGEAIRANTNLRVALRVQTVADSRDVIDDAVAAHLPRRFPGRGFVRLGPGELVPFQSAYGAGLLDSEQPSGLLVETIEFGWEPVVAPEAQAASEAKPATGTSELDRLTEVALASFARLGWNRPRASWAPPLPESLEIGSAPSGNRGAIGVVDRPDEQTTAELQWSPELGGLLSFGVDGSGATDAVVAAAGASALAADPGQLHVYGIDAGRGRLHEMESWPHVGAVVRVGERERLLRLIRRLHGLLETRRRSEVRDPTVLVVVDRIDGLLATLDGPGDVGAREMFSRVAVDGPRFGVLPLLSAERPGSVPAAIASSIGQRLCFRLADPFEYAAVGLAPRDVPDLVRGRGFDSGGRLVQVGRLSSEALLRVKAMEPTGSAAPDIGILPDRVPLEAVSHGARLADGGRFVPIGLGDRDLLPVGFRLHAGDHVLVAGPARSGRTTTLASIARLASAGDQSLEIVALAREGSLLETVAERTCRSADELVQKVQERSAPTLVLIDDAERIDHPGIARLLGQPEDGLHVVAAGRADVLRGMYQHWTRDIRRCRLGLSLCPQPDLDGELWQTQFPRRGPSLSQPGRGYLVAGGEIEVVQVAAS